MTCLGMYWYQVVLVCYTFAFIPHSWLSILDCCWNMLGKNMKKCYTNQVIHQVIHICIVYSNIGVHIQNLNLYYNLYHFEAVCVNPYSDSHVVYQKLKL